MNINELISSANSTAQDDVELLATLTEINCYVVHDGDGNSCGELSIEEKLVAAYIAGQLYVLEQMKGRGMHFDHEGGGYEETWGDTPSSEGLEWSAPEELLNLMKES